MSNALDISKILVITTSVFAYIRFDLEKIDVNRLLKDLKKFYSRRMKDWSYDEFIEIFLENWPKHYESFEEFKKGQDWSFSIRKDNRPTDNAQKISEFRPVFLELFNHALLLNSENKSEQLSDFLIQSTAFQKQCYGKASGIRNLSGSLGLKPTVSAGASGFPECVKPLFHFRF